MRVNTYNPAVAAAESSGRRERGLNKHTKSWWREYPRASSIWTTCSGIGSRLRGHKKKKEEKEKKREKRKKTSRRKTSKFFICGSRSGYSVKLAGVSPGRMVRKNILRVSVSLPMFPGRVAMHRKKGGDCDRPVSAAENRS